MPQVESFAHSPLATRRVLRDRFERTLRTADLAGPRQRPADVDLPDVEMLELLLRVQISHGTDVATVQAAYAEHRSAHPEVPTFDELLDDGWFGVVWGRVTTALHMRLNVRQQAEPLRDALGVVFNADDHRPKFAFDDIPSLPKAARPVAEHLLVPSAEIHSLRAPSPDWVVARLWEQRPVGDNIAALRWWVDRCRLVGRPLESPTQWWSDADARAWRRAAFEVLQSDPGLVEWEREKTLLDARLSDDGTPALPLSLIERWRWLNEPDI